MKSIKILSGILAIALVLGVMVLPLTGCGGGDDGGSSSGSVKPGDIPDFTDNIYANYQPITQDNVDELYGQLTDGLDEQLAVINDQLRVMWLT